MSDHLEHVTPAYVAPVRPRRSAPRSVTHSILTPSWAMVRPPRSTHVAMGHTMAARDGESPAAMDHGGMGHDMSDPAMAAAMERDMRNSFFVALLLTIPTVLYSPLGASSCPALAAGLRSRATGSCCSSTTPVVFWSRLDLHRRAPTTRCGGARST